MRIDGQTLVYDRNRYAASCLNEFAGKVWRERDGETFLAEFAAALGEDERAVWLRPSPDESAAANRSRRFST